MRRTWPYNFAHQSQLKLGESPKDQKAKKKKKKKKENLHSKQLKSIGRIDWSGSHRPWIGFGKFGDRDWSCSFRIRVKAKVLAPKSLSWVKPFSLFAVPPPVSHWPVAAKLCFASFSLPQILTPTPFSSPSLLLRKGFFHADVPCDTNRQPLFCFFLVPSLAIFICFVGVSSSSSSS